MMAWGLYNSTEICMLGAGTSITKEFHRRECMGMGFSHWARLAVSNKRLTKETLQSGPRERLERSRRWRWARAWAGKNIAKEMDGRECVGMGFSCGHAWRVRTKG